MNRWRAEETLRDLQSGHISEHEAERRLNDLYPDGYAVEDTVCRVVRDANWTDPYDGARKVEQEWEDEEARRHRREEEEEGA